MNQRRRELESPAADASMRCECECDRVECFSSFRISVEDFEDVCAHARRFIVAPVHQSPGEPVISRTQSYLVTEKAGRPRASH
jgi:hypothetical protein